MSETEDVRGYFTRSAVTFDSLYSENKQNPLMRFINRKFRHDIHERFTLTMSHLQKYQLKTALDVGCGSGRYALGLAEIGIERMVGVDLSPKMIELSENHTKPYQESTNGRFEFICGDFMEFQTTEDFDTVIAMGLFDYIKDPTLVLKKMLTHVNHSVVASFPSISIYRTPIRKIRYYLKRCPVYFYDQPQIASYASKVGFAKHEVVKIKGAGMDYFVAFFK
ncbi:class I SAM-dependent methyltransferase [Candidatus Poribacteria bacterium]|nr:class I SAM-dependent methyltransferase [Candidatus Poribacteria bacterium]